MLTFKFHPNVETLLEAAVGTSFSLSLVNDTTSLGDTIVHLFVLHSTLKEAFARFARQEAVVVTTDFVPAHGTALLDIVFSVWLVGLSYPVLGEDATSTSR